jgi:hypothetical protein
MVWAPLQWRRLRHDLKAPGAPQGSYAATSHGLVPQDHLALDRAEFDGIAVIWISLDGRSCGWMPARCYGRLPIRSTPA